MVHMTQFEKHSNRYVAIGCELMSEFRKNGSADCVQQKLINNDGFMWLSIADYRGKIKPDEIYEVGFWVEDEADMIPVFWIATLDKVHYKFVHRDPFPNADPEIRAAYMKDGFEPYIEFGQELSYDHKFRYYDGCIKGVPGISQESLRRYATMAD